MTSIEKINNCIGMKIKKSARIFKKIKTASISCQRN